jgi:serine/threonine protein kinase
MHRLWRWQRFFFLVPHHASGVGHRDLKPENILVYADGDGLVHHISLADFGRDAGALPLKPYAQTMCTVSGLAFVGRSTETVGTLQYMPPSVLCGIEYDKNIDYDALLCMLYSLLHGKLCSVTSVKLSIHMTSDFVR